MVNFDQPPKRIIAFETPDISKEVDAALQALFESTDAKLFAVTQALVALENMPVHKAASLAATSGLHACIRVVFVALGARSSADVKHEVVNECIQMIVERINKEL